MLGDNCTSTCLTRDHETWGECRRANGVQILGCREAAGRDRSKTLRWEKNLEDYRNARKQGIDPKSTWPKDVAEAVKVSDETGKAFVAT